MVCIIHGCTIQKRIVRATISNGDGDEYGIGDGIGIEEVSMMACDSVSLVSPN